MFTLSSEIETIHADRLMHRFSPMRWAFAEERRGEIDAHFAAQCVLRPLWNGRVLLSRNPRYREGCFQSDYFETDFASFLAWRDWDFPDNQVFNGFGMAAIRSADGAFILGEMAGHTANAGKIYFPAGTPDPNDRAGEIVDLEGSVVREVLEETGLASSDYNLESGWTIVRVRNQIGHMRVLQLRDSAEVAMRRISQWLAGQTTPELSAVHAVRRMGDCPPTTTDHVRAFLAGRLPS